MIEIMGFGRDCQHAGSQIVQLALSLDLRHFFLSSKHLVYHSVDDEKILSFED